MFVSQYDSFIGTTVMALLVQYHKYASCLIEALGDADIGGKETSWWSVLQWHLYHLDGGLSGLIATVPFLMEWSILLWSR